MFHGVNGTRALAALALCLGLASLAWADATVTQTFILQPGWNPIYLEVQPAYQVDPLTGDWLPPRPEQVFADLPVESVWTFFQPASPVQFIQSPDEENWNKTAWGAWIADEERAFLTNLFAVFANRAYLVKLGGDAPVTWTVTGRPDVSPERWQPNSFNLTGLRIDPANPPTFAEYFAPSGAHTGQAVYRYDLTAGAWTYVDAPNETTVQSGEAYWIYCDGASNYQGPVEVSVPVDGLDFAARLDELTVTLHNLADIPHRARFDAVAGEPALRYRHYDPSTGYFAWPSLDQMPAVDLPVARQVNQRIGVRRAEMGTTLAESLLTVTTSAGTRLQVPVRVEVVP